MKNNNLRKKLLTSATLLTGGLVAMGQTPQKPNIVLFMVDDMGWQDTSEPFWSETTPYNEICHTPNMERLADQGVKFTNAYACAISSPTRTSLMTGMNMARHRVTNWTLKQNTSTDAGDNILNFPSWNYNGLQPATATPISNGLNATTLAQLLKDNGYFTVHTGKAHWGSRATQGSNPENLGFDVNIAGSEVGGPASYYGKNNFGQGDFHVTGLDEYYGQDIYLTEALTEKALKTIKNRPTNKPFYLYMAHYAIHIPIQKDPRFEDRYKNKGLNEREIAYLTMIEGMDKSLGDIMDYLETNNLTQNTIVIFMSDNGGHNSVGNITKNGISYAHNYPLRGAKGSAYEGGIREPMMVKWPGITTPNTTTDEPVIIEDFFPSILEMAGVKNYTTIQQRDGISFIPILKNPTTYTNKDRELYWHFPNKWGETADGSETYSSIIKNEYKFIYRWKTGAMELYNIKNDIGEKNNLINSSNSVDIAKAKELATKLSNYLRSVNAQRPTNKTTGKIVVWPDEAPMPEPPVTPKSSNETTEYWYKIHDNRGTENYWTLNSSNQVKLTTETSISETTTPDKLFKIVPTADGKAYKIYAMSNKETPISAANTANNTPLYANATNSINSWTLTPSTVVPNYFLIASQNDSRQLNSYSNPATRMVSFWMPNGDTDPGNRWAFIPGKVKVVTPKTEYPTMSRYFTNPTAANEQAASRYLTKVSIKIGENEKNILTATQNPTETSNIQTNTHYKDAVVDATTPIIDMPQNATAFQLTCLGSQDNPKNLRWAQQNVFIDWNKDFDFLDENESGERNTTTVPFDTNITAPGYTRTIQIPNTIPSGIYRMRIIYHEADSEWKTSIWNDNLIKNGIAYDFQLKITNTNTNVATITTTLSNISVKNGIISIAGTDDFDLFHISGKRCNPKQAQPQGIYLVKANETVQKVIIR